MSYKVFQNGFPLPASDLNNFLMNQAVMAFANAAARTSAIASPIEGMLSYLEDTNSYEGYDGSAWVNINDNSNAILKSTVTTAGDLIVGTGPSAVSRLGIGGAGAILKSTGTASAWQAIGASGRVLTSTGTDVTWAEAGGAGMVQIATTSLSGSSVVFTSIPSIYRDLRLELFNYRFTTNGDARLRLNGITTSSYADHRIGGSAPTAWSTSFAISLDQNSTTGNGFTIFELKDYTGTHWKTGSTYSINNNQTTATLPNTYVGAAFTNITAAITSMQLLGNWSAGTATLFGVR